MAEISLAKALRGMISSAAARDLIYLEGDLEPDHDKDRFRLYPDAINRMQYFVIRKDDVKGEIYEWEKDELAAAGRPGQTRYRIPLDAKATVQWVSVWSGRLDVMADRRPASGFAEVAATGLSKGANASLSAGGISAPYIPGGSVLSAALSGTGQLMDAAGG